MCNEQRIANSCQNLCNLPPISMSFKMLEGRSHAQFSQMEDVSFECIRRCFECEKLRTKLASGLGNIEQFLGLAIIILSLDLGRK